MRIAKSRRASGRFANARRRAFKSCEALQNVAFSEGLATVGSEAFHSCKSLQRLDFQPPIETIERQAFEGCYSLHTLVFNAASPLEIGENAFCDCQALTAIEFPPGLRTLGDGFVTAFACKYPSRLVLPMPFACRNRDSRRRSRDRRNRVCRLPGARDAQSKGVPKLQVANDRLFPDFERAEKNRAERLPRRVARLNPLRSGRFRCGKIRSEKGIRFEPRCRRRVVSLRFLFVRRAR